jgi:FkbM family methyltransferase
LITSKNTPNHQAGEAALKDQFRQTVARFVASHRRFPIVRLAARAAATFTKMYENLSYEISTNGERWLIQRISSLRPQCLFDVGANLGDWAAIARAHAPEAEIHAFEIMPSTAEVLSDRFRGDQRVAVNATGLLDSRGAVRVKHYPLNPTLTGVLDYPHNSTYEWVDVQATTGDAYCSEHAVAKIDLLKVDAEGADHLVLAGFERMFADGAIDVVQFEYGQASITSHFLLADYYRFFEDRGFVLGKLFPRHVEFRQYDIGRDENFLGPNFVAVREARPDVVRLLS